MLLPLVAVRVAREQTERWLRDAERWLDRHGSALTAVVVAAVGIVLVVDGFRRF